MSKRTSDDIKMEMDELSKEISGFQEISVALISWANNIDACARRLENHSNDLYEAYRVDDMRMDGNVLNYCCEYKTYASSLRAICRNIGGQITIMEEDYVNLRKEYNEAVAREEDAARKEAAARMAAVDPNKYDKNKVDALAALIDGK